MSVIRVDLRELEKTADAVDEYVISQRRNMRNIDKVVGSMASFWQGPDYAAFLNSWNSISKHNSDTRKTLTGLENYASALRRATVLYRDVQNKAKNRAASFCKY